MHLPTLQMQSHPPSINPIFFNPKPPILHFFPTLSQTPQSNNTRNPNFVSTISNQPQKPATIISAQRKNQERRIPWRKVVGKCMSFAAWNLRFVIAPEPLNLILDDVGFGGGGSGVGRRKKGFGGGFERRWEMGVVGFLVWGWVLWLVLGRCGERVLASALLGCWSRVWGRRRRRKWGLEIWCCVLGVLVLVVGLWRDERLERIVEGFGDRLSVLQSALKRRRGRGGGGGGGGGRRRKF